MCVDQPRYQYVIRALDDLARIVFPACVICREYLRYPTFADGDGGFGECAVDG
jgi:hypothetical protein